MSELKHQLMLNKERSWVPVYLKSEADKEIAELEENHKMEVEQLLIEIAELKVKNAQLKKQSSCAFSDDCLPVRQLKREVREQKYKRCIDKAAYWLAVSYNCIDYKHQRNAEKNHYRWLDLAVKIKKETKQ